MATSSNASLIFKGIFFTFIYFGIALYDVISTTYGLINIFNLDKFSTVVAVLIGGVLAVVVTFVLGATFFIFNLSLSDWKTWVPLTPFILIAFPLDVITSYNGFVELIELVNEGERVNELQEVVSWLITALFSYGVCYLPYYLKTVFSKIKLKDD